MVRGEGNLNFPMYRRVNFWRENYDESFVFRLWNGHFR